MPKTATEAPPTATMATTRLAWVCQECDRECIPIRDESRCLCGHRLRHHNPYNSDQATNNSNTVELSCTATGCKCRGFLYIFAEGSFVLRCRCKHKHTEHDPQTHACSRSGCECRGFNSPWVCNCNHKWERHRQLSLRCDRRYDALSMASEVNRWDLVARGSNGEEEAEKQHA
jgi:hypothetical protein